MLWYIYMFVLPFSNGENFQFNPHPAAAVVIATIALPLVSTMIFTVSARTIVAGLEPQARLPLW